MNALAHQKGAKNKAAAQQPTTIQPKLMVNAPSDRYEQEADAMAERVMRMAEQDVSNKPKASGLIAPSIQRKCSKCEEEDRKKKNGAIMRKAEGASGFAASPGLVSQLNAMKGGGSPLPEGTRSFMENAFSADFSGVRVHTDGRAVDMNRDINAKAFTYGSDIYFNRGQYAPESGEGKRLLAHELTHTIQQSSDIQKNPGPSTKKDSIKGIRHSNQNIKSKGLNFNLSKIGIGISRQMGLFSDPIGTLQNLKDTVEWQFNPAGKVARILKSANCKIATGITNNNCSAYAQNDSWLPKAYVNNATCACKTLPNVPTSNCVRKFLQDRLNNTPANTKSLLKSFKPQEILNPTSYSALIQIYLTPKIYQDHKDAYSNCCCPGTPAYYPAWIGVTTVPLPCSAVNYSIKAFGSCHGYLGPW